MSGVLAAVLGSAGITTSTFNITAATIPATAFVGYCDGTAGTSGAAAGSITGGSFGPRHIAEINVGTTTNRLRVKGFAADPGQGWLRSVTANSGTQTGAGATYSWSAGNLCATWDWSTNAFGFVNGNTYNGNTITHGP